MMLWMKPMAPVAKGPSWPLPRTAPLLSAPTAVAVLIKVWHSNSSRCEPSPCNPPSPELPASFLLFTWILVTMELTFLVTLRLSYSLTPAPYLCFIRLRCVEAACLVIILQDLASLRREAREQENTRCQERNTLCPISSQPRVRSRLR